MDYARPLSSRVRIAICVALAAIAGVFAASPAYASAPAHAFPDASNTGVPAGTTLTASGPLIVTTNGAVIDALDVSGRIRIQANDVTIKRSRITGGVPYQVRIDSGFTGTVVEDSELIGNSDDCSSGISNSSYTARRLNVHGCKDGLKVASDVVVEDSWIYDQRKFAGTHNDGIQSVGGSNVLIQRNTIEGPFQQSTSAILAQTNLGPIDNFVITHNYLSGGSFTVYLKDKGTGFGPPTNSAITYNTFERDSWLYGIWTTSGSPTITGNVYDDGQPAP